MSTPSQEAVEARGQLCDWLWEACGIGIQQQESIDKIESFFQSAIDKSRAEEIKTFLPMVKKEITESRTAQPQEWSVEEIHKDGFGGINHITAHNIRNTDGIIATLFSDSMSADRIVAAHNASLK